MRRLGRVDIMQQLIGLKATSKQLWDTVNATSEQIDDRARTVKVYSDCVYYNYHRLGMSMMFKPTSGYKLSANAGEASLNLDQLILDGIDIFNAIIDDANPNPHKTANKAYQPFPHLPIEIQLSPTSPSANNNSETSKPSVIPTTFLFETSTTGKDLVSALGEPSRKGGGGGPSGGSIAIWCDWTRHGIMVEFGGPDSIGPKAWESGKDARWAILSLYEPDVK